MLQSGLIIFIIGAPHWWVPRRRRTGSAGWVGGWVGGGEPDEVLLNSAAKMTLRVEARRLKVNSISSPFNKCVTHFELGP